MRAKISYENQFVARVDYPAADAKGKRNVKNLVRDDTVNYVRVPWAGKESLPSDASWRSCASG